MDREAWRAVIHGVAKSRTRLNNWAELNWIFFCIYVPHLLIHSSINGTLGYFCVLGIVNSVAMNIVLNTSFLVMVFSKYAVWIGIAGLYGNSIFSFLKNLHFVLYSGCTSLHSHQPSGRIPFISIISSIFCL